jgi:hypothetical protein
LEKTQLPDGLRFSDERGSASVRRLQPGVLLFHYVGHLRQIFYDPLIEETEAELERQKGQRKLVILADCYDLQSVETAFRERWSDWLKRHEDNVQIVFGLIKSKLIDMAVSIMTLVSRNHQIRTFSSIPAFEAAIAREVPSLRWKRSTGAARAGASST